MTKQKKSFLDRIMGSEEKSQEKDVNITNVPESFRVGTEHAAGHEDYEKIQSVGVSEAVKHEPIPASKEGPEWMTGKGSGAEEEGQLTIDVYQTENFIVIKSIIGGVRTEDLDISITSDMVTIKGKRNNPDVVKPEDYYYQECFWGNFSRSIILPCDVRSESVEATMKNGVLTLKLPKVEKTTSMKVVVKEE